MCYFELLMFYWIRSNSLENILENRNQLKSEAEVFYHQFIPQETEMEDQDGGEGYHENIKV